MKHRTDRPTSPDSPIAVPEGVIDGDRITPSTELTAVFTSPGGTKLPVRIHLFQVGHVIGVGVYPAEWKGTVLRWDNMPTEDPTVIHWEEAGPGEEGACR